MNITLPDHRTKIWCEITLHCEFIGQTDCFILDGGRKIRPLQKRKKDYSHSLTIASPCRQRPALFPSVYGFCALLHNLFFKSIGKKSDRSKYQWNKSFALKEFKIQNKRKLKWYKKYIHRNMLTWKLTTRSWLGNKPQAKFKYHLNPVKSWVHPFLTQEFPLQGSW